MQLTNTPEASQFLAIEAFLQGERLARYMPAAGKDKALAFRLYVWNCILCEAFYAPLHFAEIGCRNAIHGAIVKRFGDRWFENPTFINQLNDRYRAELTSAVGEEKKQHQARMTAHHIVSALTLGFWEHLTTKRFERMFWAHGIHPFFPNAPKGADHASLHDLIESVRRWRNRIAHHRAIFDKNPIKKHQAAMDLIKWVCDPTAVWVLSCTRVQTVINERPT